MHNIRPSVTIMDLLHDKIEKQCTLTINIEIIYTFLRSVIAQIAYYPINNEMLNKVYIFIMLLVTLLLL